MAINTNVNNVKAASPCVRNCCLNADDVCVGCYREISEIIGWRDKSEDQKKQIMARCNQRKNELLGGVLK